VDVLFHDFMADDLGTIERIYAAAELPMTAEARAAHGAFVAENRRGKHGRVVYDLERDFGLDPAVVRRRFDFYFERIAVRPED
jgi:hypothetical protein